MPTDKEIEGALMSIMSDGFNRSIHVLAKVGVVDMDKLREHYKGVGSKYYDLVTEQLEHTARIGNTRIRNLFADSHSANS
jgi:hypothetical protein